MARRAVLRARRPKTEAAPADGAKELLVSNVTKLAIRRLLRDAIDFLEKFGITATRLFDGVDGLTLEISKRTERVLSRTAEI